MRVVVRACVRPPRPNKERIMSQSKQLKKVKTYRVLKVVFYFLGLPLFLFAVFCSAIKFIGQDPFVGTANITPGLGFFIGYESFITSPALFGIWCGVGVWALISICHLVLAKTVKSRRARMFAVLAIILVVMLGGTFIMDAVFDAKIDKMIETAPEGVTIQDYKSQLSYYTHVSYGRKKSDLTKQLKTKVQQLEKVYNVEWDGIDKSGVAGNIANKPIDYYYILSDPDENGEVEQGVDISFVERAENGGYELQFDENGYLVGDGKKSLEVEGNQLVTLEPNSDGALEINGRVYSHYFYVSRTAMSGKTIYVWYTKDLAPAGTEFSSNGKVTHTIQDGIYGRGLYNESGLIADGWVLGFQNVLDILEDYYEAQAELARLEAENPAYARRLAGVMTGGSNKRRDFYERGAELSNGETADPWVTAYYKEEVKLSENFYLTRGELENLLSHVGALLGDNSLFDWLFTSDDITGLLGGIGGLIGGDDSGEDGGLGAIIGPALENLAKGKFNLGQFIDAGTMATVVDWVKTLTGRTDDFSDVYIVLVYKNVGQEGAIVEKDHLYLALYKDDGNGNIDASPDGLLLDIDFDDGLLEGGDDDEYNFDLDRLSAFLNQALNAVLEKFNIDISGGIINTILGLFLQDIPVGNETYKGLVISGISIPIIDPEGKINIDVNNILDGLLKNWYSYQSPLIKPVWEFYEEYAAGLDDELITAIAENLAKYERAQHEAMVYGSMIGSTLIGDSLGGGSYASSFGLNDLNSVRQLKADLSYQRVYFPLYAFRDMMLSFAGLVLLFYFLSFVAAEKEELYATGKLLGKVTKRDLELELEAAPESPRPEDVKFEEKPAPAKEQEKAEEPTTDLTEVIAEETPPKEAPEVPADQNNEGEVK